METATGRWDTRAILHLSFPSVPAVDGARLQGARGGFGERANIIQLPSSLPLYRIVCAHLTSAP